jgi:hypothetical protein
MRTLILPATVLLALCPLLVNDAYAGYDKTEWGMTLAQVRRLYPGGQARANQNGTTEYSLVKQVAGLTGYVAFLFAPKEGLIFVSVIFPEPDTRIDLKERLYTVMPKTLAEGTHELLLSVLTSKYGEPAASSNKETESVTSWVSTAGDFIVLNRTIQDEQRVDIRVNYSRLRKRPDAEGL